MKRLSIAAMLLMLICCFIWHGCSDSKPELRVGVILPMSGDWANFGEKMCRGVRLWIKKHPEINVKIYVEDGKGTASGSITAFNKVVNFNKVSACITGISSAILGMAPMTEKNKIFMINAGATNPKIKESSRYVLTLIPDADVEARCIAHFLIERRDRREVYVLWKNDESGKGMLASFSNEFEKLGGVLKGNDAIGAVDGIVPALLKVKDSGVNTIFIPANGELVSRVVKQAVSMGMNNILWIGYAATESPDLVRDLSGIKDLDLVFSTYAFDSEDFGNKNVKEFVESYKNEYGEIPAYYSATCYDAMDLIYKLSLIDSDFLVSLAKTREFQGVSGDLTITNNYVSSGIGFKKLVQGGTIRISK